MQQKDTINVLWTKKAKTVHHFHHPIGHFKYLRVLYGLPSIAEHYNRCMAKLLKVWWALDMYVVIQNKGIESHMKHAKKFL